MKPPFYNETIKEIKEDGHLVESMSLKEWYQAMLEKYVTMFVAPNVERCLLPCRAEVRSPETDWEVTWRRARLPFLGSELTTFLWWLLHRLLPTQERLHHLRAPGTVSPLYKACITRGWQ